MKLPSCARRELARALLTGPRMRLFVGLAALSTLGCTAANAVVGTAQLAGAIVDVSAAAVRASNVQRDAEDRAAEEARLADLRQHSRSRLVDPVAGPRCAIRIHTFNSRYWKLVSCEAELQCWALAGDGYDCEKRPTPVEFQQL